MPQIKTIFNRGDVYWANLDPTIGAEIQKIRPIVIISIDPFNRARKTVLGLPLSTSAPAIEHVNILLTGGSVARCDQLRTLDKSRFKKKIGTLSDADIKKISVTITEIMGLNL